MKRLGRLIPLRLKLVLTSIRFRLTLWFVLILGLVMLVFSVFVYTRQSRDLRAATTDRLETKIRLIQAQLQIPSHEGFLEGQITLPGVPDNAQPLLQEGDVLAITNLQGQVEQKVGPVSSDKIGQIAQFGISQGVGKRPFTYSITAATTNGQTSQKEYFFLLAPISFADHVIGFMVLASPVDPTGQLHRLLLTLVLGSLGTLVVALAGGYWLADRAMRPVKTITQAARQISETDLSRRLNLGSRDELGELADTFDQMLSRLQAAFERQRQFTADASHELRTPLTIINLETSRALAAKRSGREYERALQVIHAENEFMTRLVNNLLTLSRMDAGQAVLKPEALDLSDLALEVVERLAPLASRRGVTLTAGELPELVISGDRQYLTQMITNLVENAIKYTRGEEKCVQVETGQCQEEEKALGWLRVTDNGPGIPAEDIPHLFERFYQVDKARQRDAQESEDGNGANEELSGSGLGLSIVQWVVRAHGGQVTVESEVGDGTTFEVKLPLAVEAYASELPEPSGQ